MAEKIINKAKRYVIALLPLCLFALLSQDVFGYTLSDTALRKIVTDKINSEVKDYLGDIEYKIKIQGVMNDVITNDTVAPLVEISDIDTFSPVTFRRVTIKDSKGNIVKTIPLNIRILIYQDVLVASDTITYGKSVDNSNTRIEKKEISRYFDKILTYLPDNSIATRTIGQGNIILANSVKRKPIINKNQKVDIVFSGRNVQITLKGKALKEGAKGDIIPVHSDVYNKTYSAMVETNTKVTVGI